MQQLSRGCRCLGVLLFAFLAVSPGKAQVPEAFLQNTDGVTGQSPDAAMDAVVSQIPAALGLLIVLVRLAAVRSAKR